MKNALDITFFHANGYPSGVYRQFLDALKVHANVAAPAILDTDPGCPAHQRWPLMLDKALGSLRSGPHSAIRRQVLAGHSMGGYIALQAAARHPESVAQVVLIDAPIPTGWRSQLLSATQRSGLAYRFGPAPIAARRRDSWPSRAAAREFFAGKAFVQRWAPGVLDDFVEHALVGGDAGGEVRLRVPRDTERDIYAHIVHRAARRALRALQRQQVKISFIAGQFSAETRMAGAQANARLFAPRFQVLPHGHLIPLEAPAACAGAVLRAIAAK